MKFMYIKISFLFIIFFNYIFSNQPDGTLCTSYSDCFDCVACGEQNVTTCTCNYNFNLNGCYDSQEETSLGSNNLFKLFSNCTDVSSREIQNTYCGNSNIILSDKKAQITIPEVKSSFARNNLFCYYSYFNSEKDLLFTVVATYFDNIKIQYSYYNNDDEEFKGDISNGVNYNFKDFKTINFFVYFPQNYQSNPFTLTIESEKNGINIPLLIGLILILVVCAGTIIVVIIVINKYTIRQEEAELLRLQEERNEEIKKKKQRDEETKKKIENLFAEGGELEPKKFLKEYEQKYSNNCTICLEQFIEEQSIINLTPCHHIFHKECLHKWLCDNLDHPKCPNCNHILIEIEKEINKGEINSNSVNNNIENERNNQINNESVNTHHVSNSSNAMLNINSNLSRNILNDNNNNN